MLGVLLGAMVFGCLADRSVLGRAKEPGWDWGLLGWVWEGRGGWLAPPVGAGLRTYSISLMTRHGSQASASPSVAWLLLVLRAPAAGLPSPPPRQAGPPEGAHLQLPADSCVGNLCRLRSQLPRLLCLPAPLGHVDSWRRPQLHNTE